MLTWLPSALDDLATIWIAATDRMEVTRAADRIEKQLKQDAETKGMPY